ncbi:MAG TPA: hypothetical protein VJM32_04150 [Candidatus Saccharimonadales bacterium]|nr:hypothetical protein [Candidatus Saccharimonadales bacterium]
MGFRAPQPSRPLTTAEARYAMAGKLLSRLLPPIKDDTARHTPTVNHLMRWRMWGWGTTMALVTAVPYYALLMIFGPWVITNVFALVVMIGAWTHPIMYFLLFALASPIAFARLRTRLRMRRHGQRSRLRDRPYLAAIAFIAESEHWTERERTRVCFAYAVGLLCRGIYPLFTLVTGMVTCRLYMALYLAELREGKTTDEAISHIMAVRTVRILVSVGMLLIVSTAFYMIVGHRFR